MALYARKRIKVGGSWYNPGDALPESLEGTEQATELLESEQVYAGGGGFDPTQDVVLREWVVDDVTYALKLEDNGDRARFRLYIDGSDYHAVFELHSDGEIELSNDYARMTLSPDGSTFIGNPSHKITVSAAGIVEIDASTFYLGDGINHPVSMDDTILSLFFGSCGIDITDDSVAITGVTVAANDIEITDTAKGVIVKSPDGTRYRIKVANGGALSTEVVA